MRQVSRATGVGAVAIAISSDRAYQVEEMRIHLNVAGGAGAGNLVISLDALGGPVYDVVFLTQDMAAVIDLIWLPTRPHPFVVGDIFKVDFANANAKTYGIEVVWSGIP